MPTTRITVTSCPSRAGGGGTGTGEGSPVLAAAKTESTVVDSHGMASAVEETQYSPVVLKEQIGEKESPMAAAAAETGATVEEDTAVSKVEDVDEVDEIMEGRSKDHDEAMVERRDAASTSNNPDDETEDAAPVGVAAVTVKDEPPSSSASPVDDSQSTPFDEKQVEKEQPTDASPPIGEDDKKIGLNTDTNGVNENDTSPKNITEDDNADHKEPLNEQQDENRPVVIETPFKNNAAASTAAAADDGVKATGGPLDGDKTDTYTRTGTTNPSQQVEQTVSNSDKNENSTGDDSVKKEEEGNPQEKQSQQEAGSEERESKEEEKKDETNEETNINASLGGAKVRPKQNQK